jgi:hypothetical protein
MGYPSQTTERRFLFPPSAKDPGEETSRKEKARGKGAGF